MEMFKGRTLMTAATSMVGITEVNLASLPHSPWNTFYLLRKALSSCSPSFLDFPASQTRSLVNIYCPEFIQPRVFYCSKRKQTKAPTSTQIPSPQPTTGNEPTPKMSSRRATNLPLQSTLKAKVQPARRKKTGFSDPSQMPCLEWVSA